MRISVSRSSAMSLFGEFKRRNVFRVGAAYVVTSWLLVQVAETIFPLFGFDDTPARIVVIVLAIGLIPTLVFAWAFELTPAGLKKESEVDRSQPITPRTGKRLDRIIMVVLALALGYFAFDKFVLSGSREATIAEQARSEGRSEALVASYGDKSIAVLPFVNMSADPEQEYFSDGLSEELLNLLTRIPQLRVISRSSAFSFKGRDLEIPEIAERLNVAHILEGSVRKAGNRVRITTQLIEARSDTHLWSETYDRTLDDVFAVQDEIAATVVEQLRIKLLGDVPRSRETDPEAYALYLQARHLGRLGTAAGYEQSNALYRQVLAIDPVYAAAWNGLSTNYANQAGSGLLPLDEGAELAREAAEKALAIDPSYAKAHAGLAYNAVYFDKDLHMAARHLERALALDPADTDVLGAAATLLMNLGRLDEAVAIDEYVATRDPANPKAHGNLSIEYFGAGEWSSAIASSEAALRLSPGYEGAQFVIGASLLLLGEPRAALAAMQQESSEDYRLAGLSIAHHALGEAAASDAALAELIDRYGKYWAYNISSVMAYRSDADRAFEWLEKAMESNDLWLAEIVANPLFNNLSSDPRWLPFLASIGKSPEQLAAIEFEVKLPR